MRKRAVSYRRVSTSQQRLGGYSLPQQKLEIEAYAATQGITLVGDYADDQTGSNMDRPGLEQALDALQEGKAEALIICESDRLTRSAPDYMWLRETLREMGAELHNARRGRIDLDDFGSQIVEDVYGRVAEMERRRIVDRMRGGKISKARQGMIVFPHMTPYGYRVVDETVVIDPEEAEVVREIFNLYASGETMHDIARTLSKRRVPTYADRRKTNWTTKKKGYGKWGKGSVRQLLRNETYAGTWHYNKTGAGGVPNPRSEWVPVSVPPIIEEELFETARKKLLENKQRARRNTKRKYLAQGRVTCVCGKTMQARTSYNYSEPQKKTLYYPYYKCGAECQNLKGDIVDGVLWQWIKRLLSEPEYLTGMVNAYFENEANNQNGVAEKLAGVRQQLDRNRQQQRRLAQAIIDRTVDEDVLDELGARLRDEKVELLADERRLVESLENLGQARDQAGEILRLISTFNHGLRFFDDEPFHIRENWVSALDVRVEIQQGAKTARFTCFIGSELLSIETTAFRCPDLNWQVQLTAILPLEAIPSDRNI